MNTANSPSNATESIRTHPKLASIFKDAESRHLTNDELATIQSIDPDLGPIIDAAKKVREVEKQVVGRVVKEVFSQYDYEAHHDYATSKCPRDVRYVVAYGAARKPWSHGTRSGIMINSCSG